jgi:transcription-repair coupling factor (superfamily II helicase)
LTQLVLVEYQNGEKIAVPVDDMEIIHESPSAKGNQENLPKNNNQKTPDNKEQ